MLRKPWAISECVLRRGNSTGAAHDKEPGHDHGDRELAVHPRYCQARGKCQAAQSREEKRDVDTVSLHGTQERKITEGEPAA